MGKHRVGLRGRWYNLRLIDFGEGWGVYFVASTQLLNLIHDEESGYICDEAIGVDELIFYFLPTHYFRLSGKDLRDRVLSELG